MKNDFKKIKEETTLSNEEKGYIFMALEEVMKENPIHRPTIFFYKAGAVLAAIVLIVGTSTSISAESSLPGNALYPIKINVNEKVAESFAWTDEAKARVQISFVEKRIDEIEKVANQKDVEPEELAVAVNSLIEHNKKAAESIQDISENAGSNTETQEISDELSEDFENALESYDSIASSTEITQTEDTEEIKILLSQVEDTIEEHKKIVDDFLEDSEASNATSTEPGI